MIECCQASSTANHDVRIQRRYAPEVTAIDLRRLRLRPRCDEGTSELELEPFVLGGQRYELSPPSCLSLSGFHRAPARRSSSCASGRISRARMRCLAFAEIESVASAREFHDPDAPPADGLHSDYVSDGHLDVAAWARDVIAPELPDQILCRPDCAGLCPVCGKDLNVEPHEHTEREPDRAGPRSASSGTSSRVRRGARPADAQRLAVRT